MSVEDFYQTDPKDDRILQLETAIRDYAARAGTQRDIELCKALGGEGITSFTYEYAFLSNFYTLLQHIPYEGMLFCSVEHAYQAAKTPDFNMRRKIQTAQTSGQAKKLGRLVEIYPHWNTMKDGVMMQLLYAKFPKDAILTTKLRNTYPDPLVEGNTWGDKYWGAVREKGHWFGENKLGQMLMQIRGNW